MVAPEGVLTRAYVTNGDNAVGALAAAAAAAAFKADDWAAAKLLRLECAARAL